MIQIDMKMPQSCGECRFMDDNGDYPYCIVLQQNRGYTFNVFSKKFPNCPLKEPDKHDEELASRKDVCRILFNRCRAINYGAMCIWCGLREQCEKEHSIG